MRNHHAGLKTNKTRLPKVAPTFLLVTLAWVLLRGGTAAQAAALDFHVATNGADTWSGKLAVPNASGTDGPFASVGRAQSEVRKLSQTRGLPGGGVNILVHQGTYRLRRPLMLEANDSGSSLAPVTYLAAAGESVRLIGGQIVSNFEPVVDPAIIKRLDESARGHVLQANLRSLGLTNFGTAQGPGLELFFQDQPMPLARWPNEGFVKIIEVVGKTPVDVRGTKGCAEGQFTFDGDRPARWTGENDIWVHGYWFWDWADQRHRVKAINPGQHSIELEPPYHGYGYRKGQWFYAYNLLAEIDRPGEWYLDRQSGVLYFWPPAPIETGQAVVSELPNLLAFKDVAHVTFRGFIFEVARETAITVSGGQAIQLIGCTIRNVGGSGIQVSGGKGHQVVGCDLYHLGGGGISMSGGDRATLAPAGQVADNNYLHHYGRWRPMYSAGISLAGVGNRAAHNLIAYAPHQAISFGGNDHLIEFNEIHDVCLESNDAGAIYAGRDWTMRGTVIKHNYLHDISGFQGKGCVGVYLDDMFCGTEIVGNLFYRVTSAAFIGGGRDCRIENNIFVECNPAIHVDARALGWAKYHADEWVKEGREKHTLSGTAYNRPPYSLKYPELVSILSEDPWAPRGNIIVRNVCVGGRWDDIEAKARPLIQVGDNLTDKDPLFVEAPKRDFRLRAESPALKLGFAPIPLARIGLYQDKSRASWPLSQSDNK
jgi:hypothetical protein